MFKVKGRDIPIVHRIVEVHDKYVLCVCFVCLLFCVVCVLFLLVVVCVVHLFFCGFVCSFVFVRVVCRQNGLSDILTKGVWCAVCCVVCSLLFIVCSLFIVACLKRGQQSSG